MKNQLYPTLRHFLALAGSSLLAISSTQAQSTLFWSGNGTSQGGEGTWDTTEERWGTDEGGPYTSIWNNSNNDTAVFAGTAGTVTLGTGITAGGLTFNTAGYTITGNTLTLAGASAPIVNVATGTSTIASNIAGTAGLEKSGTGTLVLTNSNNPLSGAITISAGTLQIGNNTASSLGSGTYAGNISIDTDANLHIYSTSDQTLSGIISGDGDLLKSSAGTLTLGNNNTYTGKTSILPQSGGRPGGTLIVSSLNSVVGGTASSSLGAPTTVANGTITIGSQGVGRPAELIYTGDGETTDRVIDFRFNNNGSVHTISNTGEGLLKFTSTPTSNRGITANSTGFITLSGDGDGEFSQGIPIGVSITKSGSGIWTLGGPVGIGPKLTVNAGTLALQKKNSLQNGDTANWTAAKINVKDGATLALNVDSEDVDGLSADSLDTLLTAIYGGTSTAEGLQEGAILGLDTSTATGGSFTQGDAIADSTGTGGGALGLTKLGTGTLVLDKANTYTGPTTINAGTLVITGATQATSAITFTGGSLGLDTGVTVTASSAAVDLANGTITVTGTTVASSYTLLTAASITGTPVLAAPVSGYELQLAAGDTQLRLVQTGALSHYDTWSGGAPFDGDANGDGVSNGLAFLLGAGGPNDNALGLLPTVTESAGGLVLTFQMLDATARGAATLSIEHSNSLAIGSWTTVAVPDSSSTVDDVVFTVSGSGPLDVTATIPATKADGGKLFGRLKAENP